MEKKNLQIMVTNDDGVFSPGLLALAQALRQIAEVYILAPWRNWSATGHTRTFDKPLRARDVTLNDGSTAWVCDGSPADCVALALRGFFEKKIDLVLSGINTSANLGDDVTYSGTIAAAIEATIWGIPAIAVSLDKPETLVKANYDTAASYAGVIARNVYQNGLPRGTLLNVNVPYQPENQIKGFQVTRQGTRIYHDVLEKRSDPRGQPYYWVIGDTPSGIAETGTDMAALADSFISITPLRIDLTDHQMIAEMMNWHWNDQDRLQSKFEIQALPVKW
jgi:5'-nucleotidase